jgi:hypothetical protein
MGEEVINGNIVVGNELGAPVGVALCRELLTVVLRIFSRGRWIYRTPLTSP